MNAISSKISERVALVAITATNHHGALTQGREISHAVALFPCRLNYQASFNTDALMFTNLDCCYLQAQNEDTENTEERRRIRRTASVGEAEERNNEKEEIRKRVLNCHTSALVELKANKIWITQRVRIPLTLSSLRDEAEAVRAEFSSLAAERYLHRTIHGESSPGLGNKNTGRGDGFLGVDCAESNVELRQPQLTS